jgi:hypothetical protein
MVLLVEDARAQWAELDRRISAFDALEGAVMVRANVFSDDYDIDVC